MGGFHTLVQALLAFILGAASAQQIPPIQSAYRDFSGGFVDNVDPVNLKPNESPAMLNVVVDDPVGSLKPRNGFDTCGSLPSGNKPTALFEYSRSDGTRRLIASDNATVYSTSDCQTFTTVASGLNSASQVHFKTIRDKLWIVNGSTWPRTWDGSTLSILDGRANTPSSPTMPKCGVIEFWKERVWCGSPSGEASAVYFSALTASDGTDLDPSTGTASWPAINVFQVDQNAGSRVFALKAYRNRLYVFKTNGVWEIGFDGEFDNFVRKTFASVGSRYQTSITEIDGILYFVGPDGVYAFDGDNAVRISEKIKNKFRALNQPQISQNYKTWTIAGDFDDGTLSSNISTYTTVGSITMPVNQMVNGNFENGTTDNWTVTASTDESGGCMNPSETSRVEASANSSLEGSYNLRIVQQSCLNTAGTCSEATYTPYYTIIDGDGTRQKGPTAITADNTDVDLAGLSTDYLRIVFNSGRSSATANIGVVASRKMRFRFSQSYAGACAYGNAAYAFRFDDVEFNLSTGTWTSEEYDAVAVSTWMAFSANQTENSGSIVYQIRLGTNTGGLQSTAWSDINPGALINGTSAYIKAQVRAFLYTSADTFSAPSIEDVQIAWNSGGANTQQIYAHGWQNGLWIAASSGSSTTNNFVLRRARPPLDAWMPNSISIGPMATYNDVFYAGASTHSAIYRMDYGTNDDGAAIPWHWESKDENYGLPNNAKQLREVVLDFRNNSSCNIRAGYVKDTDTTYCVGNSPSANANLTGGVGSRRLFFNGGQAYTYRLKVCDDQKDQVPTITGMGSYVLPIQKRGD